MVAFKHFGFWQCMDTLRDKKILDEKLNKILQLVQENFNNRWNWIHRYHLAKKCLSYGWSVTSISTKKP